MVTRTALPTALIGLMVIGITYVSGLVICGYTGSTGTLDYLQEPACDIISYGNAKPSSTGIFEHTFPTFHTNALSVLPQYHCQGSVYFEYSLCTGIDLKRLPTPSPDAHQRSIESAIQYANSSHYDGFIVTLCDLSSTVYYDLQDVVLTALKTKAQSLQMKYGIRMFGDNSGFNAADHKDSAEFISVSFKWMSIGTPSYTLNDYQTGLDPASIVDHWVGKGLNRSKLVFDMRVHVYNSNTLGDNVMLTTPQARCSAGDDSVRSNVRNSIRSIANETAIKVKNQNIMGIYLNGLAQDDFQSVCLSGKFPFVKSIKANLA